MCLINIILCAVATSLTASATPISTPDSSLKNVSVRLRLEMDLRSGRDKIGEPILFTVNETVYGPNHILLLEKGDSARGHVTESSKHGAFGHNGKLTFTCDYAVARDGSHVPLFMVVTAESNVQREDTSSVGEVGVTATIGRNTNGYRNSPEAYQDYEQTGVTVDAAVDAANLLRNGDDETAARGEEYKAVSVLSPAAGLATAASVPEQVFTLKDKSQFFGSLLSFNRQVYVIETPSGTRNLNAAAVATISALPSASRH